MNSVPGTVVGVKAVDGIVIAAEKRLTYDGFVLSKNTRKVFAITPHVGVGFAGLMGDIQLIVRVLKYEAKHYELQHNREIRVRGLAKLLSIILYSYKLFPMLTEIVVGGVDDKGPQLYVLDPVGSLIEDNYVALGSGGPIALGVIETKYSRDMTISEAKQLGIEAIREAVERDAVSGDGVDVLVISRDVSRFEQYLFAK